MSLAQAVANSLDRPGYDAAALAGHEAVLAERVFQVTTKWPHFRRLLDDVRALAADAAPGVRVVSLERSGLYGGCSLIAPFFHAQDFASIDCSPDSAEGRGAYNAGLVDDPRFLFVPINRRGRIEATGLVDAAADLVLVPNLVHHVADQDRLFAELARILAPGGRAYVFEPVLRELHQIPDDYLRWTPFGMARAFARAGLAPGEPKLAGGPFEAIAYCWVQALEYFPEAERAAMADWFYGRHFPELMAWDAEHRDNRMRRHTAFPVAFSLTAEKPA